MDLIYAAPNGADIGVLDAYTFDLAYGSDENNFEITLPITEAVLDKDYILYIEGTEYGGLVDSIKVNTEQGIVTYNGRTWHGLIESKVIRPDSGQDYFTVEGEANTVLASLITRLGLQDMFRAPTEDSGINISYQFQRYVPGYTKGMLLMLQSAGAKLKIVWSEGIVELSAVPIFDYAQHEDFNSDQIEFIISNAYNKINHLICLGAGDLSARMVIDLYCDALGNISQTQTFFNLDEHAEVFDFPNAESEADLIEKATDKFKEYIATDTVEISIETSEKYDIGDIVGAFEEVTKTSVVTTITKKIVTITNNIVSTEYKVGGR